jgi:hypothetical protein
LISICSGWKCQWNWNKYSWIWFNHYEFSRCNCFNWTSWSSAKEMISCANQNIKKIRMTNTFNSWNNNICKWCIKKDLICWNFLRLICIVSVVGLNQ